VDKILLAKQNSVVYGVFHKIQFIVGDFFSMAGVIKGDVIVTSPPWGGPEYIKTPVIGPLQLSLHKILATGKTMAPKMLFHLPKNVDKYEVCTLFSLYIKYYNLCVDQLFIF